MSRGAIVVICSDGLDRGDPAVLAAAMERLSRLCHRIVWMNPHKGDAADFRPNTLGMMVAAPHVDLLLSGPRPAQPRGVRRAAARAALGSCREVERVGRGRGRPCARPATRSSSWPTRSPPLGGIAVGHRHTTYGAQLVVEARPATRRSSSRWRVFTAAADASRACRRGRSPEPRRSARTTTLDDDAG